MDVEIVGKSALLAGALDKIDSVARTRVPVLILGESGVGKELIARTIHRQSAVSAGPLVRVNCAAVPRELFESEFFGHARGSFTGAHEDRAGRFERAHHGTLFLDEVSEIPLEQQGKLLRVLQEGEFERVGDTTLRASNARVVAASNRDLRSEVRAGRFREDLYYRLSVFPIEVPPLRERPGDVEPLARHFLGRACREFQRAPLELTPEQVEMLDTYPWPGNVRELENVIHRAVLLSEGDQLRLDAAFSECGAKRRSCDAIVTATPAGVLTLPELKRIERRAILAALSETRWRVSGPHGAAALLEVKPTTLASRMKAMGIERPR